jgi:surface antigen Omp85-like protein
MARCIEELFALAAVGAAALARPLPASGQDDVWSPQTVPLFGVSYSPDLGLQFGAGLGHTRYGFRALPASTRLIATAEYATGAARFRARADGEFRRPLAPAILSVEVLASGLELTRFYGFGNASDGSQPDSVYRVRQQQFLLAPTVSVPLTSRVRLAVGPLARYTRTHPDAGTVLGSQGPYYGAGDFGEVGMRVVLELDTRDSPAAPASGAYLRLASQAYPAAWDVAESFGVVSAEASTYLSLGDAAAATLALRAGGASVRGTAPFNEAVYVGGGTTVRGYAEQRFAGRSGAYANAELRLAVGRLSIGDVGVFGLADGGRVWIASESSDRWHGGAGGGVWFAWRHRRANIVSIALARSPERTAIYVRAGLMF